MGEMERLRKSLFGCVGGCLFVLMFEGLGIRRIWDFNCALLSKWL